MSKAALWATLIGFVGLVTGLFGYNLVAGNTPVLGLDLRGGLSVIYATAEPASEDDLVVVRDLMRAQLESFGIAEPDVRVEGVNIIVDLPGVTDQESAFDALQVSGIVELRPVIGCGEGLIPDGSLGQEVLASIEGPPCLVGQAGGTGEVFAQGSADIGFDELNRWAVNVDLRDEGLVTWNSLASLCFNAAGDCPSRQLAIVLDDVIQSAPTVNQPSFPDSVQISGSFTEDEARALSRVLNRGAFPVPVVQERVETVSATAGQDSLDAAIIAGVVGLVLVLAFMVAYYRKLSVVIVLGMIVWGMAVFSLATFVSRATNYALTLAGATGIIVAVALTVDSYVVFFERLREERRRGRTYRNAAHSSFEAAWRTIRIADLTSLIGSIVLFWLTVGSVKGFALYLGLTTICSLAEFHFFTRPAVLLLAMSGWLDKGSERGATAAASAVVDAPAGAAR